MRTAYEIQFKIRELKDRIAELEDLLENSGTGKKYPPLSGSLKMVAWRQIDNCKNDIIPLRWVLGQFNAY